MSEHQFTNALIHEKSPYLLQHAHNPVNWLPWGEAAFTKAKQENKPVFLSIGYSTCHWCHVMEHESFQDSKVADLLNTYFIPIKVDREERPDVDDVYMTVCQMITGSGGWPLSILLTPDKKPFFAATYIPKTSRFGRKGMLDLLPEVALLWKDKNESVLQSAKNITAELNKLENTKKDFVLPFPGNHQTAFQAFSERFDRERGGFGNAPKFPSPHNLLFLLRYGYYHENPGALNMVTKTLTEMGRGGIYDHIGYGFHRYSTDRNWRVPHFEKMLYDQAMLIMAYSETYQATRNIEFKTKAEQVCEYVLRDMTAPEGGFYSAEDADSEGVEGKFYVWSFKELLQNLTPKDLNIAVKLFNIDQKGNYHDEATRELVGNNILYQEKSVSKTAQELGLSEKELNERLNIIRETLYTIRKNRVHPLKDDKILTDWNGMMIAALAKAGNIFGNHDYIQAAEKATDFIFNNLEQPNGRLLHRYRLGDAAIPAFLDDYAFFIWGLIELYSATFNTDYLIKAKKLFTNTLDLFWDDQQHGFNNSASDNEKLLLSGRDVYDGATPSGNSVMFMNLLTLAKLTGDTKLEEIADQQEMAFSAQVNRHPSAHGWFVSASEYALSASIEIIVCGDPDSKDTRNMLNIIKEHYLPNKVTIVIPPSPKDKQLISFLPWLKDYKMIGHKATVYVCRNRECQLPVNETESLRKQLEAFRAL